MCGVEHNYGMPDGFVRDTRDSLGIFHRFYGILVVFIVCVLLMYVFCKLSIHSPLDGCPYVLFCIHYNSILHGVDYYSRSGIVW